jgi:three-Cys-motif partner protein
LKSKLAYPEKIAMSTTYVSSLSTKWEKNQLFLVEIKKIYLNKLRKRINEFIKNYPEIKDMVEIDIKRGDCNQVIDNILKEMQDSEKYPIFILIDPWGLQIKKATLEKIAKLKNPKDIILNYILEGVRRVGGVVKKAHRGEELNVKEIKTIQSFKEFLGQNINIIGKSDRKILEEYISVFSEKGLNTIGYDMPYSDRKDILYYLLFSSRKPRITDIVRDIYHRERQKRISQKTLFGDEYEKENIFVVNSNSKIIPIRRKSLLYKTKVEYGDWTINHIIGCRHGCRFPCYAMMMAKKFGWVKDYEDWRKPRIAVNAIELLEREIPKYEDEIKHFVHLCFMSDPFMYDFDKKI